MSYQTLTFPVPVQTLRVYDSAVFRVSEGVNLGDALTPAEDLLHEDVYELAEASVPGRLSVAASGTAGQFEVAAGSELGWPGAPLFLDSLLTFMGPNGSTDEVLVIVETDPKNYYVTRTYLHPFTPLRERTGYALVTIDPAGALARLAESACVSFSRGTRITMADGRQVPVEDLAAGDRVLTRNSGPQKLRWIGMQTMRATGAFAPITIAAGALNNTGPLTVSPNHRLFIYQRVDEFGTGRKEVMVKARHLVNGISVIEADGGFVDYFQLLFDKHEIIYAEGIAAESLFVDIANQTVVPPDLTAGAGRTTFGREIDATALASADAVELLRQASLR